jgi:hypothetical protein
MSGKEEKGTEQIEAQTDLEIPTPEAKLSSTSTEPPSAPTDTLTHQLSLRTLSLLESSAQGVGVSLSKSLQNFQYSLRSVTQLILTGNFYCKATEISLEHVKLHKLAAANLKDGASLSVIKLSV